MDARHPALTIGNALTFARLVLLPVVLAGLVTNQGYLTVTAMAVAILTDLLDGRISRRLGQASSFGATLDSTVDFILIYCLFIAFYASGRLHTYRFAIIYLAMLTNLVLQLSSMTTQTPSVVRTRLGKFTGALQYTYLIFLVLREVLPTTQLVAAVNSGLFAILAVAIILSSISHLLMLRQRT